MGGGGETGHLADADARAAAPPPAGDRNSGHTLTIYLIPIGPDSYELYCEPAPAEPADASTAEGVAGRLRRRITSMLREAEEEHARGGSVPSEGAGRLERLRRRGLRWVAERIAEQRLLWNLRHVTAATTAHPDDLAFNDAQARVRRMLERDDRRHRIWLVVDTILLAASAVLAILPGPNVVAYYFAFRVVGHWLSIRGARQALGRTTWSGVSSTALTELRTLTRLAPAARADRLAAIATELGLPNLPVFFDRVTP